MKKSYKLILTLAIVASMSNVAFADGNAFTPLNFDKPAYSTPKVTKKQSNPISNVFSRIMSKKNNTVMLNATSDKPPTGNKNIQNAILELDNAQVGIRNELLDYKAKYADADAQYKLIRNERCMLEKQVKAIEKRIKKIDKTKERLRKNML